MVNTKLTKWLSPLIALVTIGVIWWQKQNIIDWYRLQNYDPPARIEQLADNTTMNSQGRKLFFVHHPELDDKKSFSGHCPVIEETIVLGCYITHRKIYLFDVSDPRLSGVHEVTAAHEMLHAAYDRLSDAEKQDINAKLEAFTATLTDERILETIAAYRQQNPSVVPNELHSIIGTEVRNLTPELEKYYARYFDNRLKIIEYAEKYEKAFSDIHDQINAYDAQLASVKSQILATEAQLAALSSEINSDRAQMDAYLARGNNEAFNNMVPTYNAKVKRYNRLAEQYRRLVSEYNSIVAKRNALAAQQHELIEAIDASAYSEQ